MPLRDVIALRDSTDLDAFITRLVDKPEQVRENLRTYVVSDGVHKQLDHLFGQLGQRFEDGRDMGRYVYGTFGCGKSHLLTVLGKMLERDEEVYSLGHEPLRRLRTNHPWLDQKRVLVVRVNMMEKRSLTTALYTAFNEALPADAPGVEFTDEERIFWLIEKDAERLGGMTALLEQVANDGALANVPGLPAGMPAPLLLEWVERMKRGDLDKRLALAAAFNNWRNHGNRRNNGEEKQSFSSDDLWLGARPGFDRIARHARDLGYDAIAWLIDELVIWIRGKNRADYVEQINQLLALVDSDAARVIPFFAAIAVQMDISRTCPEDLSERDFQDQLGFIKDRFQPQIELEDQDLYQVAARRVLSRRQDADPAVLAAFEAAVDKLFREQGKNLQDLSGGQALDFMRKLYPFHPALLRILVDVTQALSRNRTAVAALYVLLNAYADLEPGQYIPVGALWDFVFTPENVSAMRQNSASRFAQRMADSFATFERLEGKIDAASRDLGTEPGTLRQLVRSVLLCQLSDRPYFPDGRPLRERITASIMLNFNRADVKVAMERTGISKVASLFRKLQGLAPQVQVIGDTDPDIHIKTEQVDIERVLTMARADVGHAQRFAYMRKLLVDQLGLGFKDGNETTVQVLWRGTKRTGRVRLVNVRTLSYAGSQNDFDAGSNDFQILVDYPFDEDHTRGRQDDLDTVQRAKARSAQWSVSWLPQHLTESERVSLDNAAAVDQVRKDERRYLDDIAPREAEATRRALEAFQVGRKAELEEAIRRIYFADGLVAPSKSALDGLASSSLDHNKAIDQLASAILDKRYPNHPEFRRKVGATELARIIDPVTRAAKTGQPVDRSSAEMADIDAWAVPLELVHKGASAITPRRDGRYLSVVLAWIGEKRSFEAAELRGLLMAEWDASRARDANNWGFGLAREVANVLILYVLHVEGFEAQTSGQSTTITGLANLPDKFRLVKDDVVDAPTWDKAIRVARRLLAVEGRAELPTSPEQAKLCKDVAAAIPAISQSIKTFQKSFESVCRWAGVVAAATARHTKVQELSAFLAGFSAETNNADRTRRLATLANGGPNGEPAPLAAFVAIKGSLASETAALTQIASQGTVFQYVDQNGEEAVRGVIVVGLRNLLGDDWATSRLSERLPDWQIAAQGAFKKLSDEEAERRRKAEEAQRALEEAARKARLAADEAERQRLALEETQRQLKLAQDQEAARLRAEREAAELARRRARREKTFIVSRAEAQEQLRLELEAAMDASSAERLSIRIVVENADS